MNGLWINLHCLTIVLVLDFVYFEAASQITGKYF